MGILGWGFVGRGFGIGIGLLIFFFSFQEWGLRFSVGGGEWGRVGCVCVGF